MAADAALPTEHLGVRFARDRRDRFVADSPPERWQPFHPCGAPRLLFLTAAPVSIPASIHTCVIASTCVHMRVHVHFRLGSGDGTVGARGGNGVAPIHRWWLSLCGCYLPSAVACGGDATHCGLSTPIAQSCAPCPWPLCNLRDAGVRKLIPILIPMRMPVGGVASARGWRAETPEWRLV